MNVQLFIPCFIDQLYPQVGLDMARVLEKLGCQISYNPNQTCCGQPAYNAGYIKEARAVSEKFVTDFSGTECIVAPSGSCVGYVRGSFDELFENASCHKEAKQVKEEP